ncbi:uncharacterized protein LOC129231678 [Uloborus diversus]|uniref:uncharacterized protein LOC129231678 n=1 Tax=Uloborus diversus TaxID=327109 RepID=UPI0024092EFD|nr:uncharacterized protein LOC129231678 [Uloborus diversus]
MHFFQNKWLFYCVFSLSDKRQVTYQADDNQGMDEEPEIHSIRPVTRKPLPAQVVYPGDLSSFYTTEMPSATIQKDSNETGSTSSSEDHVRRKRSGGYIRDKSEESIVPMYKNMKPLKPLSTKYRQLHSSESRLHSSYHKPSVSVMNDVPAELYFDGAGFLRYEDDSEEVKSTQHVKPRRSGGNHGYQEKNKALNDFRAAFNMSRERDTASVKFDDDISYQNEPHYNMKDVAIDHGAQGTETGAPLGIDFMQAYQQNLFGGSHPSFASQIAQTPQMFQQDPFSFNYPSFFQGQSNLNQMMPVTQQDSLLQNHRTEINSNLGNISPQAMFSNVPQQNLPTHLGFTQNQNYQQFHKTQRRKRSIGNSKHADKKSFVTEAVAAASEPNQGYRYSREEDQQDSSSGFIPITGTFNGGTIQLSFPLYGNSPMPPPSYSSRSPVQAYHTYSVPVRPEGRPYRSMERFYHPSEARRYSYGILGSGNFEVIRGGVFPNERPHGLHGGYQGGRAPYGGDEFGNYGTTEIILDGPIQGFQGFDNFPAHLINALSKHSELAVRPHGHETEVLAA